MDGLYMLFIFLMGCIFGSFFYVVGYRVPKGLSIVFPGSSCPKCGHELKWYELIPVVSYLIQGGKCRSCKQKISIIYPVIELTTGILFALSYFVFGFSYDFVIAIITVSFLVIVIVSDINYLLIPDEFTIFFTILLIVAKVCGEGVRPTGFALLSGLATFTIMYLIMLVGNFIFKKETLGGGDIKLMFFVGTNLGIILGLSSIFVSAVLALPLSIIVYFKDKRSVIPFGPFILIATFIILLFKANIMNYIYL